MILDSWKKVFALNRDVRFGPIVDKDGIKLFYDEDEKTQKSINNLQCMLECIEDTRSIIVAGHAGSGKTTLVHYVRSKISDCHYSVIIINAESDTSQYGILQSINREFNSYFDQMLRNLNTKDNRIHREIKKIIDSCYSEVLYKDKQERLSDYLITYDKIYETPGFRDDNAFTYIRIILDQIDLLDSNQMMKILYENFTPIIQAKYITAVICARHETLDSSKKSVNNFFATNFNRSEEINSVPVDLVLKKRLEDASENKLLSRKLINNYFTESFCILMSKIQNGNIRKVLAIFEQIMSVLPPFTGKEATEKYTNFLLEYNYFDDIFIKLNPSDNLPVIKIVFDALQYQSIVNRKFYDVVISKILIATRNAIGITETNINAAIEFLKNRSFISDSFDIQDRYVLTPKGVTYKKMVTTKVYLDRFCKSSNDKLFIKNLFNETSFLK